MTASTTPIARLLQDWMWSQRPPWTGRRLATEIGVGASTVWNWLNADRIPQPHVLPALSHVTGISLETLYEVCGYPKEVLMLKSADAEDQFIQLAKMIESDTNLSEVERKRLLKDIETMRRRYEAARSAAPKDSESPKVSSLAR